MRRGRLIRVGLATALALFGAQGCIRFGHRVDPPAALTRYLDAVVRGDLATAYGITQLAQIDAAQPAGSGLSRPHFEAFFAADPLKGYEIVNVVRLDQRSFGNPNEPGTPQFVTDVRLRSASGSGVETFSVEGEVLGVVQVEPDAITIRGRRIERMDVDGVRTTVRAQRGTPPAYPLLLIRGRHTLDMPGIGVVILRTFPLTVEGGPARVVDGAIELNG